MATKEAKWSDFLAPRYWGIWLAIGLLRLVCLLPSGWGYSGGRLLGKLLFRLMKKRRLYTQFNIRRCFPELTENQQSQWTKEVFENNAIGLIEMGWAYWKDKDFFRARTEFRNFELLEQSLAQSNGIILMGWHFSCLDLAGLLFSLQGKTTATLYRKHDNPMLEWFFTQGRSRFSIPVERKKNRLMLRSMRKNHCIWYAPDQDLGKRNAVFVPFFGHPAATTTATSKLHTLNNSPLLVLDCWRKEDDSGYILELRELSGFPSGSEVQDATLINQAIEEGIRKAPTQYMWVHKRFKTQPDGKSSPYRALK